MSSTTRAMLKLMLASWLVFAQLIVRIHAQTTDAVCQSTFGWMNNTRGQSPCLVASYALSGCSRSWNIPALPQGQGYVGPLSGESNSCQCSTVTYSLLAACAACQNGQWRDWPFWSLNCTAQDIAIARYPLPVPSGTAFPAWAYLDPALNGNQTFDVARAFALDGVNLPDTSGVPSQTAPSSSQPLSTPSGSSTTSTSTGAPTVTVAAQSTTDVPSIVGGTVGGVLGLALIGVLIYFIYKHNESSKRSPSSVYMASRGAKDVAPSFRSARSPPNGHVSPYKSPPSRAAYSPEVPTSPSPLLIGSNATLPPLVPVRRPRQYESPGDSTTQYNPTGHSRDLSASTLSTNQHHHAYGGSISVHQGMAMQYPSTYAASTHSSQRLEPNRLGSPMSRATGAATPEPYRGRPQI